MELNQKGRRPAVLARRSLVYRRLALLMLLLSLIVLSLPGHWLAALQDWIRPWWPWPSSGLGPSTLPIDKAVHALLFAVCGALFVRGWGTLRERWWLLCAALFLYGGLTELLQRYVPGRSASWGDVVADGIGVLVGVGLSLVYLRRRR
jgi:VanZ family protein